MASSNSAVAVSLHLEGTGVLRFMRFLDELKPDVSLLRLFEHKNGVFSVHGSGDISLSARLNMNDLRAVAQLQAPSGNSLKPLDTLTFNRHAARALASAALFSTGKKVELYSVSADGTPFLTASGSPGNLAGLEDSFLREMADTANGQADTSGQLDAGMSDCTTLAVKMSTVKNNRVLGVASWDSTSQCISMTEINEDDLFSGLESIVVATNAREAIFCEGDVTEFDLAKISDVFDKCGTALTTQSKKVFSAEDIEGDLEKIVGSKLTIAKFLDMKLACAACAALLSFAGLSSDNYLQGKAKIQELKNRKFLQMDHAALRALNVFPLPGDSGKKSSLFGLLNSTKTAMGSRLLRRWLAQPLQDVASITERLRIVSAFLEERLLCDNIRQDHFKVMPDINIICRRFTKKNGANATLQDVVRLYKAVRRLPHMSKLLSEGSEILSNKFSKPLNDLFEELKNFEALVETTIDLDQSENGEFVINPQVNGALKELRLKQDDLMRKIDSEFSIVTSNINLKSDSLKLERKDNLGHVFRLTRKNEKAIRGNAKYTVLETRRDGIRFQTRKLSKLSEEFESIHTEYEDKASEMRQRVMEVVGTYVEVFQDVAAIIAAADVLSSFANVALTGRGEYCRPDILPAGEGLVLKQARHPIVEENMDSAASFIANDIDLRRKEGSGAGGALLLVTGPNMGGKSTFIRTAGVVTLLAHVGAYVPAEEASVPLTDRILARVGAGDNHHRAISTFMAEMLETASILKAATSNSLVIIDELGRGTGTMDGFGLAHSISSHIATAIKASCLFATHFYELTALADTIPAVQNFHVTAAVNPGDNKLTFLYEVSTGACDKSFGVHVAEMAHFPSSVIEAAKRKAAELENDARPEKKQGLANKDIEVGQKIISKVLSELRKLPRNTAEEKEEALRKAKELRQQLMSESNPYVRAILAE